MSDDIIKDVGKITNVSVIMDVSIITDVSTISFVWKSFEKNLQSSFVEDP